MEFPRNWIIKLYALLALAFNLFAFTQTTSTSTQAFLFITLILLLGYVIYIFTQKVVLERSKVTIKSLFGKKSILINPYSLIYIKRNSLSVNIIFRTKNFQIRIENSPTDILKINADVQDADALFSAINDLEQRLITPKVLETFSSNGAIQMKGLIQINEKGFKVFNKIFNYDKIKGIKIKEGNFTIFGEGRMWDRTLFSKPIYEIPNLHTNLILLSQFTQVE